MKAQDYIIMTASANRGVFGYNRHRVAVVEVDHAALRRAGRDRPIMISDRAIGVKRVIKVWDNLYSGKTHNCQFQRALAEANKMISELTFGV